MNILEGEIILPGEKLRVGVYPVKNKGDATDTVKNIPKQNNVNRARPSALQYAIMNILTAAGQPIGEKIGHLPRTGDIVDALGLPKTNSSFASVSRSLSRMEKAGRIVGYTPYLSTRGNGRHWGVKP
ncbi:MAG: hypothetical protein ACTHLK_22520 [Brucella intermedia]